jgi:signal transduction histidine kinase
MTFGHTSGAGAQFGRLLRTVPASEGGGMAGGMARPVPWVPPVLYVAVLAGGVWYSAIGPGVGMRTAGFAAVLAALVLLDVRERPIPPVPLLAGRALLYVAVAALDVSGLSRVLFVLVPFLAYFAFGSGIAIGLGIGCVLAMAGAFTIFVPGWATQSEYISDLLMFTLGVALALAMAAVAVREQRARARLEGTLAEVADLSAARERNRLARDIHDSVGHHLTAIGVQLEAAEAFSDLDPGRSNRAVANARWSAGKALEEVRTSVRALATETGDLTAAMEDLVRHLDDGSRKLTLTISGAERRPLLVLYRAAQEGLANACRHADAAGIEVELSYDEAGAELRISDDGQGFDTGQASFGLNGLRERVRLAGGTMQLASSRAGTVLTVAVPW